MPEQTPENQELELWKKKSISEKLNDWSALTAKVYHHDCGITALGAAAFFTSGIFGILLIGGLGATLGSRARSSNEQQEKLDHLYEQYCAEVKSECAAQFSAGTVATGLVNGISGIMNTIGYGNPAVPTPNREPVGLQILKVIGPYIPPQKIPVWDCDAESVPKAYREEMYKLGLFSTSEKALVTSKGLAEDHTFQTENKKSNYIFCHVNPGYDARISRRGRLSLYGQQGLANKVLSPIGKVTGAVVDGATSFFCSTAQSALPVVKDGVQSIQSSMNKKN
jgi:hypothetical protein